MPHAPAVTTADVTDRKGCLLALERGRDNLGAVQKLLADGGYTGKAFASSVQELIGAEVEIAKRNELLFSTKGFTTFIKSSLARSEELPRLAGSLFYP